MQFNKTFLALVLFFLISAALIWSGVKNGWFVKEDPATTEQGQSGSGKLADKVEEANNSLNKTFSGAETPISVTGSPVVRGPLVKKISSQGRVHSYLDADITTEIAGRIVSLNVRDGMNVKKGEQIATIDDRQYQLELASAKAKLLEAKANYLAETYDAEGAPKDTGDVKLNSDEQLADLKSQFDKGLISSEDYHAKKLDLELQSIRSGSRRDEVVQARTLKAAEVEVNRARLNLEKCEILAPFSGQVFQMEVAPGQLVGSGIKVCRLTHLKDLVVKAQVLESEIGKIIVGRSSKIVFTALPDLPPIQGEVEAVSPVVNSEDKTVETIVRFRNVDGRIRPGMFADLKIDAQILDDRLMVPKEAVLPRDDRKVVFKVGEDNRAKWLYVKTGEENDEYIEIVEGKLEPGDVVLIDNHFTMGHDTLVKVKISKGSLSQDDSDDSDD